MTTRRDVRHTSTQSPAPSLTTIRVLFFVFTFLSFFSFLFFFWDGVLLCCPGWSAMAQSQLTATFDSWVQAILCLSLRVARITDTCHHAQLIFVFLVETGFHHLSQADFELLTLWSTHLSLPKCWDYMSEPLCLDVLYILKWKCLIETQRWLLCLRILFYPPWDSKCCWQ